jgi:hypothetical protein
VKSIKRSLALHQGDNGVKEIKIQLRSHEERMLSEVQKVNKRFRDPQAVLLNLIRDEYLKTPKGKAETT